MMRVLVLKHIFLVSVFLPLYRWNADAFVLQQPHSNFFLSNKMTTMTSYRSLTNVLNNIPRGGEGMLPTSSPVSKHPSSLTLSLVEDFSGYFASIPFMQSVFIYAGANLFGFLISLLTGSHLHLDLLGTGAFVLASLPTLFSASCPRIFVSSAAVSIWGTKLAGFLFFRALRVKTDARLHDTLSTASGTCECDL